MSIKAGHIPLSLSLPLEKALSVSLSPTLLSLALHPSFLSMSSSIFVTFFCSSKMDHLLHVTTAETLTYYVETFTYYVETLTYYVETFTY